MSPDSAPAPRRPMKTTLIVLGVVAVGFVAVVALVAFALTMSARASFLGRYSGLEKKVAALETSAHRGIACDQCHADTRGPLVYRTALVGDYYRSLVGKPQSQPQFVRFSTPTNEACLACHSQDWSDESSRTAKVPHPAHLRVIDENRPCAECHRWVAHEEGYMQAHTKMPFSKVCASFPCHVGTKTAEACQNCHHILQDGKGEWKLIHKDTVRAHGPNECLEVCHDADQCRQCHLTGKRPIFPATGPKGGTKAIENEHVKPGWIEGRHGQFAMKDEATCLLCHVSITECQDCHSQRPAFHGLKTTWLNRHRDLAKADKQRCLTCHEQKWCDACHAQFKAMH